MNYLDIIYFDTGNSHTISTTVFVSGCSNGCKECHNPQSWDFNNGFLFSKEVQDEIIKSLKNPHIKALVVSGGDPFFPMNRMEIIDFLKTVKRYTTVPIIGYTGYLLNSLLEDDIAKKEAFLFDYLIDGPFIPDKRAKTRQLRGSTNQKCYHNVNGQFIDITEDYFKEN